MRLLLGEAGGEDLAAELGAAERIVASRLVRVEAERTLLRIALDRPELERFLPGLVRDLHELCARIDMIEITEELCALAGRIAPSSRLRTLDAIHLATYHELRRIEPRLKMMTFDERLLREL